ncbi:MAG: ribonuclease HI [Anaerolineae bacterium]|nr:ribonuclease HI [Anaerolineae bacterium]
MTDKRPHVTIYTDGGADPNPGPGGWGVVLIHPKKTLELSGGEAQTTNNRMELTAVIEALSVLKTPCVVDLHTDSQYVQRGITEWIDKWIASDWRRGKRGEPVLNEDLWRRLHKLAQAHEINWHWVKGHAGDEYNERADRLASAAIPRAERQIDPDAVRVILRIAGPKHGRGAGGWAAAAARAGDVQTLHGRHPDITANQLVIYAALEALKQLPGDAPVYVYTNNSYLHDGVTRWVDGWRRSGWTTKTGEPVKFREMWQALDQICRARGVMWVRFGDSDAPPEFDALRDAVEQARAGNSP